MSEWQQELESVTMVDHALAYARKGWPVHPLWWCADALVCACPQGKDCSRAGKHPLTENGFNDATIAEWQIELWWDHWPHANIGIATGKDAGFLVLDVDGDDGLKSMEKLIAMHQPPAATVVAITGSGGRHILWKHEAGVRCRVKMLPGLDVRSDGGYIVAPPSLHSVGERYRWHPGGHPARVAFQPMPDWARRLLFKPKETGPKRKFDGPKPSLDISAVPPIEDGERNDTLCKIGGRLRWEGKEYEEIEEALLRVNAEKCNPPKSDREVKRVAKSVSRYPAGD